MMPTARARASNILLRFEEKNSVPLEELRANQKTKVKKKRTEGSGKQPSELIYSIKTKNTVKMKYSKWMAKDLVKVVDGDGVTLGV